MNTLEFSIRINEEIEQLREKEIETHYALASNAYMEGIEALIRLRDDFSKHCKFNNERRQKEGERSS